MTFLAADASQVSPGFPGCILWMTGLSASGKTTLCGAVAQALATSGRSAVVLDGDVLRQTLSSDLGFSRADREENMRRIATLAFQHATAGSAVLVAAISPYRQLRETLRRTSPVPFFEVFVDAPLPVCEARDPKGLYRRARAGAIPHFTGIDDIYEPPATPDAHCHTAHETIEESCARLMALLKPWLSTASPQPSASAEVLPGVHTPA
jgi:adenylylsulfate kinase